MEITDILERAKQQMSGLTGLKPLAVTRAFKEEDGWHIAIEMLEMARVPDSTDVLGCYEALVTEEGDMVRFDRKRTRLRGQPVEDEEG